MKPLRKKMILILIFMSTPILLACNALAEDKLHFSIDGRDISYTITGKRNNPLVFIHCWTCDSSMWSEQVNRLSRNHKIILLDLPGHGSSSPPVGGHSIENYANDVVNLLDHIGDDNYVLVGHSMGGPIAYEVNQRRKNIVTAIIGVDTFNLRSKVPIGEAREEMYRLFERDYESAARKLSEKMFVSETSQSVRSMVLTYFLSADREMATSSLRSIFSWYDDHPTEKITESIGDKLWSINSGFAANTSSERIIFINGVGHFPAQEDPKEFNDAIEKILAEIAALGRGSNTVGLRDGGRKQ